MFQLTSSPIEPLLPSLKQELSSSAAGALVFFEGIVRDHNDGRKVTALEYEAYPELCQSEAGKIMEEARQKFSVTGIRCLHRTGRLRIGEIAVWIAVGAGHRGTAFSACRYLIDEIKARLPIWKKEFYEQGDSGWVSQKAAGLIAAGTRKNRFE